MSGSMHGGQLSGQQIQQGMDQLQQQNAGFNPYSNPQADNQITDPRQGGLLAKMQQSPHMQTVMQGLQGQAQMGGGGGGVTPMPTGNGGLDQTMQGLLGLQQQAKQNKQAILKAFMGGG
jgi:hypothetical protein